MAPNPNWEDQIGLPQHGLWVLKYRGRGRGATEKCVRRKNQGRRVACIKSRNVTRWRAGRSVGSTVGLSWKHRTWLCRQEQKDDGRLERDSGVKRGIWFVSKWKWFEHISVLWGKLWVEGGVAASDQCKGGMGSQLRFPFLVLMSQGLLRYFH